MESIKDTVSHSGVFAPRLVKHRRASWRDMEDES